MQQMVGSTQRSSYLPKQECVLFLVVFVVVQIGFGVRRKHVVSLWTVLFNRYYDIS